MLNFIPSLATFRRIVRASAIYDLALAAPFATPWTFALVLAQLSAVNQRLGGAPLPAFSTFHVLIACLMGSIVLVWSVLRIADPQPRFGRYDAAGRFLFSTWMAWALAVTGEPLIWLFLVLEAAWCVVQCLPVRAQSAQRSNIGSLAT
ncbi:hypothetical protein ASD15_17295 [Massilia sp. Root351]|jgi:hypothetical protein|uniref:hypothetical protein n=1 Tax=Massilia sp. Root351 TaxID=1736522 RepID=UPI00070E1FBC|nr:hypothetical protein [Massilia sp. Root351]KQV79786.1 hypothetical protein ASD15_17295 [Massilia sp. Root351]